MRRLAGPTVDGFCWNGEQGKGVQQEWWLLGDLEVGGLSEGKSKKEEKPKTRQLGRGRQIL